MNIPSLIKNPDPMVYTSLPYVVLDVETTNTDMGSALTEENRLILSGFYSSVKQRYASARCNQLNFPANIINYLEGNLFLVGHNIKFDLQWLVRAGLDLSKVLVWDTMLGEKVLLGNNPHNKRLGLGSIAVERGYGDKEGVVGRMIKAGVCPSTIPPSLLEKYCKVDVMLTHSIFLEQREEMLANGLLPTMLTRCLLTPALADIEAQGLCLDKEQVISLYNEVVEQGNLVNEELKKMADINFSSGPQKATFLYDTLKFKELRKYGKVSRTASGRPKTDLDSIKNLAPTNSIQRKAQALLVEQSNISSQLSKSLNKYKECVNNNDLMYARFNQHITKTHRLSSTGAKYSVNLQNQPRQFKKLFCARNPDWWVVNADGSNLEFRVAVELGNDEVGRADIANPEFDAHNHTAKILTESGQETSRQDAKKHTFKPLYGGESGTPAEQAYYKEFKERYKGIAAVQEAWRNEALSNKSVRMPWGFKFYYPKNKITRTGYHEGQTQICNYPVQSLATADIIPIALVGVWHSIKERGMRSFLVNTVHDSIMIEAPIEEKDKLNEIIRENFTDVCYNYLMKAYNMDFKTPLDVDIIWGKSWSG